MAGDPVQTDAQCAALALAQALGKSGQVFLSARRVGQMGAGYDGQRRPERIPGTHPICPVMLGDAALAGKFADAMLKKGVYVIGFSYPVVPQGKARIRTQISAAHSRDDLEKAISAFAAVKKELGV